ncbi:MAG: low molecular weight phosphatase family protein [Geminicoccaceae bacterium]
MADQNERLPGSVLFACSHNALRSPMAAALMRSLHGRRVYVDSVGLRPEPLDPFAVAVLDEIGIDLSAHRPKGFDELEDDYFDLVISLSPEAHHRAVELTRTSASDIEFWPVMDPTLAEGHRDVRLDAYRSLRDHLLSRLRARFPRARAPVMA